MSDAASDVDATIWRAIAGPSVDIPPVNSLVFYFPQGHMEHWSVDSSACGGLGRPYFHCRVLSVNFLSHPTSDEMFVKYLLQPEEASKRAQVTSADYEDGRESDLVVLGKVLTMSDANNGGGFSIPRACADSVLPQLDFTMDPAFQTLTIRDARNMEHEFRHIYRGTPRRHMLTTGWSKFVNKKRLIAGDSVIFMRRTSTNELFVGIRRSNRIGGNRDWVYGYNSSNSYPREPLEAIQNAARGMPFEVVYYPRIGSPDFVVRVKKVVDALQTNWIPGMRIRFAVQAADASQTTLFQGTVKSTTNSLWRMLEVAWNEPGPSLRITDRVNPWDVVYVPFPSPSPKKSRTSQAPGIQIDGARVGGFSFAPMAGHVNFQGLNLNNPPFSADMQGARQDEIRMPRVVGYQRCNGDQTFAPLLRNYTEPELRDGVAMLNLQTSGYLSRGQQTGDHLSTEDLSTQKEDNSPATPSTSISFQLFGQTIHPAHNPASTNNVSETGSEGKEVHDKRYDTDNSSPPMATIAESTEIPK